MTIDLYNNKSQNNVLSKDIVQIKKDIVAKPYDAVSMLNPVIVLDYNADYLSCNYVYIHEWGRYYYATLTVTTAQTIVLTCSVDVLMSFKDTILNSTACITRSASKNHGTMIPDATYPMSNNRFIKNINFPQQPFKDKGVTTFILEVRN